MSFLPGFLLGAGRNDNFLSISFFIFLESLYFEYISLKILFASPEITHTCPGVPGGPLGQPQTIPVVSSIPLHFLYFSISF